MDLSETVAPRSDQQNYDDYLAGPKTVTVTEVRRGTPEQPVEIHLAEFPGRPWKPCKSMRRVLVAAWGPDASTYAGRRMTLYGDPSVKFGGSAVGGIRVSHLSHIDCKLTLSLTSTRGKRAPYHVEPLIEAAPITPDDAEDFARDIAEATTVEQLDAIAADLKAFNLGTHRKQLQDSWAERRKTITE